MGCKPEVSATNLSVAVGDSSCFPYWNKGETLSTPGLLRNAESPTQPADQNQTATGLPKQLFLHIVFLYL